VRATKYNKRITIQKLTPIENEIGGWSNLWTDFYSSWASVIPVTGFKKLEYAKLEYNEAYEVEMRKRLINVDGDCRIVYRDGNYQIISIMISDDKVNLDIGRTAQ
jgi:SPP1 family predicted phage head-tail adaptor